VQITDFLAPESADHLRTHLEQSDRWRHIFNVDDRTVEVPGADWDATPDANRAPVLKLIDEAAAYDFQYQYDSIRVPDRPDERARSDSSLDRFADFLSSPPVLDMLMAITGSNDLVFADCQATRYRSGDFLTPHNDELDGMHRRFAYVLSLTLNWLPRWGGLLHSVDTTGGVDETIAPRFNALSLFAIGQSHYVSQVATYAPVPRISVTGWLRTKVPG
jgi:Rps23 Pro-64 3,4-dihydroxylase Tpa1-like proline 4-hydroxylase